MLIARSTKDSLGKQAAVERWRDWNNRLCLFICASVCIWPPTLYQVYSLLPGGLDQLVGWRCPLHHLSEWELPLVMSQNGSTAGGKTEAL